MKLKIITLAAAMAAITLPSAMANHVDFLSDGGFMISATEGNTVTGTQVGAGGNIIGSERNLTLTADVGDWTATLNAPAGAGPVGPNAASFIGVTGTPGALGTLDLLYNGVGNAGLGGLDFDTVWNFIRVDLPLISGGALDLRLTVADTDGDFAQVSMGGLTTGGLYSFSFTDAGFTNAAVDFTKVNSLLVSIETIDTGVSYNVGSITREAVPEPGTTLLFGLGAFGMVFFRRYRKA
jgi:hypothetical protein